MICMNTMNVNKYASFASRPSVRECVDMVKDLYKHKVYETSPKVVPQYASFAQGEDYNTKLDLTYGKIEKTICDIFGIKADGVAELHPQAGLFANQTYRDAFFAVIAQTVDEVNIKSEVEQALIFAEIQSGALGDNGLFNIGSKNVIAFQKDTYGKRNGVVDQVYDRTITITPEDRKGTVGVDIYKLAARREDLGLLVMKATRGMRQAMMSEVVDLMFETASPAVNSIYLNTFAQATFQDLVEQLESLNDSQAVRAYGVRSALAPVLPTEDNLKFGLGEQVMMQGYVSDLFGVPAVRLAQAAKTGSDKTTTNFIVPKDHIILLSGDTDKPVKIFMEGRTKFVQTREGDTADNRMIYTLCQSWGMKIASQSHFGLVKTR